MRRIALVNLGLILAATLASVSPAQEPALREVKYADLADLVVKNRGKVVYVDFWHLA
jgi:hypothetical protein